MTEIDFDKKRMTFIQNLVHKNHLELQTDNLYTSIYAVNAAKAGRGVAVIFR